MRIKHGTAIYTGGGIYVVIGEIGDGKWFMGNNDFCAVTNFDTRTKAKDMEILSETEWEFDDDDLAIFYLMLTPEEGCIVETDIKETYEAFYDFCKRLDNGELGITDGYEEYSNYAQGEVCNYIDFSYFEELNEFGQLKTDNDDVCDPQGAWCAVYNLADTLGVLKETINVTEMGKWKDILSSLMFINNDTIETIADAYELSEVNSFDELFDGIKEHDVVEEYYSDTDDDMVDVVIKNLEQYVNYVNTVIEDVREMKAEGYRLPSKTYNEIIQSEINKED